MTNPASWKSRSRSDKRNGDAPTVIERLPKESGTCVPQVPPFPTSKANDMGSLHESSSHIKQSLTGSNGERSHEPKGAREAALRLHAAGHRPVAEDSHTNTPLHKGWTTRPFAADDFPDGCGVAIQLGACCDNPLLDIDLDCNEAREL